MKKNLFLAVAPAVALGATMVLLAPAKESMGFSKIGGSLSSGGQRDWRVFNNFLDSSADDDTTMHPNFPGWDGVHVAVWKAATEWASVAHGNGTGDPSQTRLGDGGGNFDFFFAGEATGIGGVNNNIVSSLTSCGGTGTLAYVNTGISNGWRMRFCDEWVWDDNPGNPSGSRFDIQGIGCHEFGHSLGLGHSNVGGATMVGAASGNGLSERSIAPDDIAGLQCIYGAMSASKVQITGINVDVMANTVTIDGSNFSSTGNQVWFTRAAPSSTGIGVPQVAVTGVNSTGGGTQIVVSIPAAATSGDIAVKSSLTGASALSNSFPIDLINGGSSDPLTITGITPGTVESLIPGTAETVTISGTGFDSSVVLSIDLVGIPGSQYTVVDDETITLDMPQTAGLGTRTFAIQKGSELKFSSINVVAPSGPTLQAGNGDPLNTVSTSVTITVAGPVGELEYVVYSSSNLPSVFLPFAQLEVGNNFSDFNLLNTYTIPASGWTSEVIPLAPLAATLYTQALTLDQGLPVADSNVSSFTIVP